MSTLTFLQFVSFVNVSLKCPCFLTPFSVEAFILYLYIRFFPYFLGLYALFHSASKMCVLSTQNYLSEACIEGGYLLSNNTSYYFVRRSESNTDVSTIHIQRVYSINRHMNTFTDCGICNKKYLSLSFASVSTMFTTGSGERLTLL